MKKSLALFTLVFLLPAASMKADQKEIDKLHFSVSQSLDDEDDFVYQHIVSSIADGGALVLFQGGMSFTINWWYSSVPKDWKKGDLIYITYDFSSRQYKLEHAISKAIAWGDLKNQPNPIFTIKKIPMGANDEDAGSRAELDNGLIFRSVTDDLFDICDWEINQPIVIFANSNDLYQLWNTKKRQVMSCKLIGKNGEVAKKPLEIQNILGMEERLNVKVLQQPEATQTVAESLLRYTAGLNDKEQPVGVFLFLGPTGVGKTELAKALTFDIYKDPLKMLRFDMSHFSESHTISRLIGSPPGYVNHEEGGQLTSPLQKNSQAVVLLDEMEKAHSRVLKFFLPVFDEGFILDSKNKRISCHDTIFILTSNLCGQEIAELYHIGYSSEQILEIIEPTLMKRLTPELYNRVQPILFKSLSKETMGALVDLMLGKIKLKLLKEKKVTLRIDDSLKDFLIEKGYHPLLGARPLKKLIDKKVITPLAYYIIKIEIKPGQTVLLSYNPSTDTVELDH